MSKLAVLLAVATLLIPSLAAAGDDSTKPAPPLTQTSALWLGPVKLGVLPPPPVPPDNPQTTRKILLGKQLYFDTRLSKDNTISCATCHSPTMGWSDKGPTSKGIDGQMGGRRAPPASNSAYMPLQFWDGRSPSLEDQAKGPIQNPIEMGNTHAGHDPHRQRHPRIRRGVQGGVRDDARSRSIRWRRRSPRSSGRS